MGTLGTSGNLYEYFARGDSCKKLAELSDPRTRSAHSRAQGLHPLLERDVSGRTLGAVWGNSCDQKDGCRGSAPLTVPTRSALLAPNLEDIRFGGDVVLFSVG